MIALLIKSFVDDEGVHTNEQQLASDMSQLQSICMSKVFQLQAEVELFQERERNTADSLEVLVEKSAPQEKVEEIGIPTQNILQREDQNETDGHNLIQTNLMKLRKTSMLLTF